MKKLIYHENTKVEKHEIFFWFFFVFSSFRAFVIDPLWFRVVRIRRN